MTKSVYSKELHRPHRGLIRLLASRSLHFGYSIAQLLWDYNLQLHEVRMTQTAINSLRFLIQKTLALNPFFCRSFKSSDPWVDWRTATLAGSQMENRSFSSHSQLVSRTWRDPYHGFTNVIVVRMGACDTWNKMFIGRQPCRIWVLRICWWQRNCR